MPKRTTDKPYLILIHGLRGSHHGLLQVAEELQDCFEVLTPDLPGSWDSPELDDKTLAGYARWLHDYCAELPRKPYIAGHSMGSIVVSHFVEKYPQDTEDKIILMAPIFRDKSGRRSGKVLYGTLTAVLSPLSPKLKHRVMASRQVSYVVSHFLTYDKLKQKEIDEQHYKYSGKFSSAESLLADARISMTETAIVPTCKETLLCIGAHDRLARAGFVQVVAREKGAKYLELPDVGHLLNYERPKEVSKVIRGFLFGS